MPASFLSSAFFQSEYDSLIAVGILIVGIALALLIFRSKSNKNYDEELAAYKEGAKKLAREGRLDMSALDSSLFSDSELSELNRLSSQAAKPQPAAPAPAVQPQAAAAPAPAAPVIGAEPAAFSAGEVKLVDVDEPTAAMIIAILINQIDAPLSSISFSYIKAL